MAFHNLCQSLFLQIIILRRLNDLSLPGHDQIKHTDTIGYLSLLILQSHLLFHFECLLNEVHVIDGCLSFLLNGFFRNFIPSGDQSLLHSLPLFETHLYLPLVHTSHLLDLLFLLVSLIVGWRVIIILDGWNIILFIFIIILVILLNECILLAADEGILEKFINSLWTSLLVCFLTGYCIELVLVPQRRVSLIG